MPQVQWRRPNSQDEVSKIGQASRNRKCKCEDPGMSTPEHRKAPVTKVGYLLI